MSVIKQYIYGIAATAFALLLAIIGVQRQTISRKEYEALRNERDEQQARAQEYARREKAQAKAAEESQERREQAEAGIAQGRRDYFEQD